MDELLYKKTCIFVCPNNYGFETAMNGISYKKIKNKYKLYGSNSKTKKSLSNSNRPV